MRYGNHPYFRSPKQEQREQFREQVAALVAAPDPTARPEGRRVLRVVL